MKLKNMSKKELKKWKKSYKNDRETMPARTKGFKRLTKNIDKINKLLKK